MRNLRLRVKLNKGHRGISLDKLEKFVAETRKFLAQIGDDLHLEDSRAWNGVEFENGSLAFTNESSYQVSVETSEVFNKSVLLLSRSEYPPFIKESTANQFYKITSVLDQNESFDLAVFEGSNDPIWVEVSALTAQRARRLQVLPYRYAQGAVQGTIHNIYVEAEKPYFTLRELSSQRLVKCYYSEGDYPAVVHTLNNKGQILHIRGTVVTDTQKRSIDHITVSNIIPAEMYGYAEVEKFLGDHDKWRQ